MITWTTYSLPNPPADIGNSTTVSTIRTKMDSGRVRQRSRFTAAVRSVPCTWELSDAEFKVFQAVYHWKLTQGADWFTIPLALGASLTTYTARFATPWSAKGSAVLRWTVSATLEVEVGSVLTEAELDALFSS